MAYTETLGYDGVISPHTPDISINQSTGKKDRPNQVLLRPITNPPNQSHPSSRFPETKPRPTCRGFTLTLRQTVIGKSAKEPTKQMVRPRPISVREGKGEDVAGRF